jgi:hypothetical protein
MRRKIIGIVLVAFTLLSTMPFVFAGLTGDIPSVRFEKETGDDNLLKNVVLEEVTV